MQRMGTFLKNLNHPELNLQLSTLLKLLFSSFFLGKVPSLVLHPDSHYILTVPPRPQYFSLTPTNVTGVSVYVSVFTSYKSPFESSNVNISSA